MIIDTFYYLSRILFMPFLFMALMVVDLFYFIRGLIIVIYDKLQLRMYGRDYEFFDCWNFFQFEVTRS